MCDRVTHKLRNTSHELFDTLGEDQLDLKRNCVLSQRSKAKEIRLQPLETEVGIIRAKVGFNLEIIIITELQVLFGGVCRCMRLYVWSVNLDMSCLGRTFYPRQFWSAKPKVLAQFHHRREERNPAEHYTDSDPSSRLPNSLGPCWGAQTPRTLSGRCNH